MPPLDPTQVPAAGQPGTPFKTMEEFEAFLRRTVAEETNTALDARLAPLTQRTQDVMRTMLEEHAHGGGKGILPKGHMYARHIRAMALAQMNGKGNDIEAAIFYVKQKWGAEDPVLKALDGSLKLKATAATASDPNQLGNLIPPQWSTEFIELLRNKPVIRSIARVIPNPAGSLTLRRQTSAGVAYWVNEGVNITASKPGVGLMQFLRKKLAALMILSNDLIRYSTGLGAQSADQFVLEDAVQVISLAEDLAFVRGDGTQHSPRGIRNLLLAANVFGQAGTTLANIDSDHAKALRLVEEANILLEPDSIHWLMVPRTYYGLMNAAPATDAGARPYKSGLEIRDAGAPQGRVLGYPVHKTNQIPKNLGGGSETETYCVHGPSLMIADTLNNQVDVFPGGAYDDGGVVVSGISKDETPVRILRETDFNLRYQEAGSCVTGVTIA